MKRKYRSYLQFIFIFFPAIAGFSGASAQIGFFENFWKPKSAIYPSYREVIMTGKVPDVAIEVDAADTLNKISPYLGGYNLNTYHGGRIFDKPELLRHIRNLDLPFFRFPGGSGSNTYFWSLSKPHFPDDVDNMIVKDEVVSIGDKIKWGDIPGDDYLSLDNSYILRDSCQNEALHVVNYSYARYGRSQHPVQQAAHYAAEWVRQDRGRTRFWSIGNENYGPWEAGYLIDTSRNADGQPEMISGDLYARHCLVFIDSMRAAAAEIDSDIKIGAVLGFQPERKAWDENVLKTLRNKTDYYVVHRYYGNGNDVSPAEMLSSVNVFYQDKEHLDSLINRYCDPYVPLVVTEWNSRYAGRLQNVSCANGLHSLLGFKAMVEEGIGLSSRWNLIWNYNDGETHGLISSEKIDLAEGVPAYFPRATFFYIYYFRKFLGDTYIDSQTDLADSIKVFSSSFATGELGINLINISSSKKTVAVNLHNFLPGERFYRYILQPENGYPFSRKVLVNDVTNDKYPAGGPEAYEEVNALSSSLSNGLVVDLPPFSTAFLLVEGERSPDKDAPEEVRFMISAEEEGNIFPLNNAAVIINGNYYLTSSDGVVDCNLPAGSYNYKLSAAGYATTEGQVVFGVDEVISDTLIYDEYSLQVSLFDKQSGEALTGYQVIIAGMNDTTDQQGNAEFHSLHYGDYLMEVNGKAHKEKIPISIYSDTSLVFQLDSTVYGVNFLIYDQANHRALNGTKVNFAGKEAFSDLEGKVFFEINYGNYFCRIEKNGYLIYNDNLEINRDTLFKVFLRAENADIKFRLYDGSTPQNKALIYLESQNAVTNALGLCTFSGLKTGESYTYSIVNPPFSEINGNILLSTDTTININYADQTFQLDFYLYDKKKGFPLEYSTVVLDQQNGMTNNSGMLKFMVSPGEYPFHIDKERYEIVEGSLEVFEDTLVEVGMELLYAKVIFHVTAGGKDLDNATIFMNDREVVTNNLGKAVVDELAVDQSYEFSVGREGYNSYISELYAYHDTLMEIGLYPLTIGGIQTENKPKIFPVPAGDEIWIKSADRLKDVSLYNIHGIMIYQKKVSQSREAALDISRLMPGIYMIRVQFENKGEYLDRIIKIQEEYLHK